MSINAVSFLSTLPARGATSHAIANIGRVYDISIHAPREGSDFEFFLADQCAEQISIHAPREGSDKVPFGYISITHFISIHAPREGSDAANS